MIKIKNKKQISLFFFVGILNTFLDLSLYFLLHQILGLRAFIASPLVVFVVMSLSYVLNAKLVFPTTLKIKQYIHFMILTGIGVITIQTIMSTLFENWAQHFFIDLNLVHKADINIFIANSAVRIAGVIFSLTWNFLFYKFVVFREQPNEQRKVMVDEKVEL